MKHTADALYNLLPAVYRIRDAERREPLKALIGALAEQAGVVETDIASLYEDWFIETCGESIVPYIGDLIGVRGLHPISGAGFSQRARVANALAYRRRKGTAAMLEQLALDTTGWRARAVEFFELLGWTQHYNHIRPNRTAAPDLRRTSELELLDTAFDSIAHTADVRHIASRRSRYNIPSIGLFLWRLQDYPLTGVTARAVAGSPNGCYTFSPLGIDAPLFNPPKPETEITHLAGEINVPGPLRRRALYDELEARRQPVVDSKKPAPAFFDEDPVFEIFINGAKAAVTPEEILICDLSDWRTPAKTKTYRRADGTKVALPIRVAVDPKLGRMRFPTGAAVHHVLVGNSYGFSGDLGGGPYDRRESKKVAEDPVRPITWQVGVSKAIPPVLNKIFSTLTEAVDAWNAQPAGTVGRIALLDSRTYDENLSGAHHIKIAEGCQLMVLAANLPKGQPVESAIPTRQRPHLCGNVSVEGTASIKSETPGDLILNGLLIEGGLTVLTGYLGGLQINHCTLVPGCGGLGVKGANDELVIRLERSISGGIDLPESVEKLQVIESIVDGLTGAALKAPGAAADLQAGTFFGKVSARTIQAGNSIFTGTVTAALRQDGCVRFCSLPTDSATSRRYRCQPDLALVGVTDPAWQAQIREYLTPVFTSELFGDPGYAQLKQEIPPEIGTGAEDGAEMGVFYFLKQPQREKNLRSSLDEYLRFGLEAGLLYVT